MRPQAPCCLLPPFPITTVPRGQGQPRSTVPLCWGKLQGYGLALTGFFGNVTTLPSISYPIPADSVTVFTGQCFVDEKGNEILKTMWLLRSHVDNIKDDWKATR